MENIEKIRAEILEENIRRIKRGPAYELNRYVSGLADLLIKKGIITANEVNAAVDARDKLIEKTARESMAKQLAKTELPGLLIQKTMLGLGTKK